jgi:F0F1-type ATP synthase membrane subunit c/vacuolar-type H+-ATPase subunit K
MPRKEPGDIIPRPSTKEAKRRVSQPANNNNKNNNKKKKKHVALNASDVAVGASGAASAGASAGAASAGASGAAKRRTQNVKDTNATAANKRKALNASDVAGGNSGADNIASSAAAAAGAAKKSKRRPQKTAKKKKHVAGAAAGAAADDGAGGAGAAADDGAAGAAGAAAAGAAGAASAAGVAADVRVRYVREGAHRCASFNVLTIALLSVYHNIYIARSCFPSSVDSIASAHPFFLSSAHQRHFKDTHSR